MPNDRIEVLPSARRFALAVAIAIGFVLLGLWTMFSIARTLPSFWLVLAFATLGPATVLSAMCGLYLAWRLVFPQPILVFTTDRLEIKSVLSIDHIRWDEIARVVKRDVWGQSVVALYANDPEAVISRQRRWITRASLRLGERWGLGLAAINTRLTRIPGDELHGVLKESAECGGLTGVPRSVHD